MSKHWTAKDIPNQEERIAVITGSSSGIGYETAKELARHKATVILACRNLEKAEQARSHILTDIPDAKVEFIQLDLASLKSIRQAANEIRSKFKKIDLLVNNAGVMWPDYNLTEDNFELQFGINHLGHFALTGLLLDQMLHVPGSRIVSVSSIDHRQGTINFDDLQSRKKYDRYASYSQSKLANLMFSYELQRQLSSIGAETIAVSAHPGISKSNLLRHANLWYNIVKQTIGQFIMQSSFMGALPTLRAATDPNVKGGEFYGPSGWNEYNGYPKRVESNELSHNVNMQRKLWEVSEKLTGIKYNFLKSR